MFLEILLIALIVYLITNHVANVRTALEEKITDLENQLHFVNDRINSLKKRLERQQGSSEATTKLQQPTPAPRHPKETPQADLPVASETPTLSDPSAVPADGYSSLSFSQPEKPAVASDSPMAGGKEDGSHEWLQTAKAAARSAEKAASISASETPVSKGADDKPAAQERSEMSSASLGQKTASAGHTEASTPRQPAKTASSGGSGGGGPAKPFDSDWGEGWRRFKDSVDWEQFTGAMLFAWLGGIALFLGAGFFVKYSIDKNLISPVMRLVIGAIVGLGMIGGSFWFERGRYDTMRQTFAAGGIGVLYSVFFAATLYYEYLPRPAGFIALSVISAAAFVLALFHRGVSISVLGAAGAYLTPLLVTTGQGGLLSLFAYLAVVNIGLYQVIRRLGSNPLLLFASVGTMFSLACGTFLGNHTPEGIDIFIAWSANLAMFALFLDRLHAEPLASTSIRWTGRLLFAGIALIAVLVVLGIKSSAPMFMMAAAIAIAVALAFRNPGWHEMVTPYAAITFMVAAFWALIRFNANSSPWAFLAFFVYGLAGGVGPVLLIYRNGISERFLAWFRIFPVGVAILLLLTIVANPNMSFLFWPVTIALQLIGIFISMIFGALPQLFIMTLILLIAGIVWLTSGSMLVIPLAFYGFLLLAGALIVLVTFYCLAKVADWSIALKIDPAITGQTVMNPVISEWISSAPIMGIFILLALAFSIPGQIDANPGMLTMVCFMAIALTLSRRLHFEYIGAITLIAAAIAQAFWALRPDLGSAGQPFHSMVWSGMLFLTSVGLPFLLLKDFSSTRKIWMSWSIYELAQAIFFVYAADHLYTREISGWIPVILAFLKLPAVARLVERLKGRQERNSILACHGGVLLFYVSLTPFLLLETGWLGLVLVLESVALLWLNHRVEHNGLRQVASIMAPIGLYLLLSWLPRMKGPDSIIILNPAIMSVLLATLAMFAAARLAPYPDDRLWRWKISSWFTWIAVLTGFYLVNLVVADVYTGSFVATGSTIRFFPLPGDILHMLIYTSIWAIFGAILWRHENLPAAIRVFGLVLLCISVLWLIAFPFKFGYLVEFMSPLFNLGLLAYLPVILVLLYLFLSEPWGAESVCIKNFFLAMLLVTGFLALKVIKASIFQAGMPLDVFQAKTATMAVASAAGWIIYGLAMLVWPKRLDRPFRLAGLILMTLGFVKTLMFPFRYSYDFGRMAPLLNRPTILFVFAIGVLVWLTWRRQDERWPVASIDSRPMFATMLGLMIFFVLNIEIASVFGHPDSDFSLMTRGSLAHQLGYSLGWLLYAIGLLICGIKWNQERARQTALVLVLVTSAKIFLKDLYSLGQLYRVASFIGLAVVLMLVSYLYQRFLSKSGVKGNEK